MKKKKISLFTSQLNKKILIILLSSSLCFYSINPIFSKQKIVLKFWHLWSNETLTLSVRKVIENWNASNPDIQIKEYTVENESYKTLIKTSAAANELPDVFFAWGAGFIQPLVESGRILELDKYLNDGTKEKIVNGCFENMTFNGKIYGLPVGMWIASLYCNKELFDAHKIKMPDTYNELLNAVKLFRKAGLTPIVVGEKERWPGMFWLNAFTLRTAGAKKTLLALNKKIKFTDPDFVKSARLLDQLVKAKAFNSDCLEMSRPEADATFTSGEIPMYLMGNWLHGQFIKGSKIEGKVVAKKFPALDENKITTNETLGGSIDGLWVSNSSKYKDEAVKCAKYLAENIDREQYLTEYALPTWKIMPDTSKKNPLFIEIIKSRNDTTAFVLAWDTFLVGKAAQKHLELVTRIFAQDITPEQFAKEMQKINDLK